MQFAMFEMNPMHVIENVLEVLELDDQMRMDGIPSAFEFDNVWRFLLEWARGVERRLELIAIGKGTIKAWRTR